jgi:hypothetical protein
MQFEILQDKKETLCRIEENSIQRSPPVEKNVETFSTSPQKTSESALANSARFLIESVTYYLSTITRRRGLEAKYASNSQEADTGFASFPQSLINIR